MSKSQTEPSPWRYIITLYLPLGIINGFMTSFPGALFKLLNFSNQQIGLLSGITLVTALRFAYAPWLDGAMTKRRLSLLTIISTAFIMFLMGVVIFLAPPPSTFLYCMIASLFVLALISASHETAADGYYIRALTANQQAQFIGIKTSAIRIGGFSVVMFFLLGATKIANSYGSVDVTSDDKTGFYIGFGISYLLASLLMLSFFIWNKIQIPIIQADQPVRHNRFALGEVLREYFLQNRIFPFVAMILTYRIGEGFLAPMKIPFYLDSAQVGGLSVAASSIPYYTMLTEIPWVISGGILGGYIIKWIGIKKALLPFVLMMNLPTLLYFLLAVYQPNATFSLLGENLNYWILLAASIESFGYGVSFSAMFYYMHIMATESGRNKTSILAISFALMNLGWVIPGMVSGFTQAALGYAGLFLFSTFIGFLILPILPFLPMPNRGNPQS